MEERVTFYGVASREELAALYHACDLLVLPSVESSEAYGLVQVEAMACGKPVVSTRLPTGITFVNRDGETGILVTPGDTTGLAKAVAAPLEDQPLRERLGARARECVRSEFPSAQMVARHRESYVEAVQG